ncbi:hypothetical protein IIU_05747 [Bacillus cereus VD133]|uniref:Uncharacterized protein n=1 Tax=Bacillus cereus VD133 TaxID=1053233 RepID=A0A9W5UZY1_BACCE|nr:hypothetical protein [Bacillus cereus]EOO28629.1 hypothetical protein IIU_05747 [Bacillus cereus VD133]
MLWLLAYLIVGMVYISFGMQSVLRDALKDIEEESGKEMITIVVTLFLICFFTPVWPALLTIKVASVLRKDSDTSVK